MAKPRQGKSTGRRRLNSSGDKRTRRVEVSLSEQELADVQDLARGLGVSVPHLLMLSVWSGNAETLAEQRVLRDELIVTWRVLANITNNLNQMARYADTDSFAQDLDRARVGVRWVMDRIGGIVGPSNLPRQHRAPA